MLILTRKIGERLLIGEDVEIVIHRISGNRVTVGVAAPVDIPIVRAEIADDAPPPKYPPRNGGRNRG